jgi:hypothetical protein
MNRRVARRDTHQSGQRFLDSSAPRLKRQIASCEAAGEGNEPLPAGKDEKLSQVRTESAVSARCAGASPSLDSIPNNRHTVAPDYDSGPSDAILWSSCSRRYSASAEGERG